MLNNLTRLLLWFAIAIYVASLPYAIVLFNFLENSLTLPVVKKLPVVLLLLFCLFYIRLCRGQKRGYQFANFLAPSAVLLTGVLILESNPIKYIHIPEYMLLTWLIYLAINRQNSSLAAVVASAIYASALGVFDEIHHGINPTRYFGWKDMAINTVGSTIGALGLVALNKGKHDGAVATNNSKSAMGRPPKLMSFIVFGSVLSSASVITLFDVAQGQDFYSVYPFSLVTINLIYVGACLYVALATYRDTEKELLVFYPTLILAALNGLIVLAYFQNTLFR